VSLDKFPIKNIIAIETTTTIQILWSLILKGVNIPKANKPNKGP
tara:strand:+ start:2569 stop:2700 length:132 start_codon:yes stop_codon:yes gene_type:complete